MNLNKGQYNSINTMIKYDSIFFFVNISKKLNLILGYALYALILQFLF